MDYREQIERLRSFEIDHEPDGWPGVRMRQISAMCDAVESLLAENERLKHNIAVTEQTMREYQELATKRLEEIAKYRDAPVAAYWYKYHNCFGDEVWATDSNWDGRTPLESKPLIVKPGEMK